MPLAATRAVHRTEKAGVDHGGVNRPSGSVVVSSRCVLREAGSDSSEVGSGLLSR